MVWMCLLSFWDRVLIGVSMSPARRHQLNCNIWIDDDMGGAEGFLRSWDGRFQKGLVFMSLALVLAVPMPVCCDQPSICPTAKAGPAFQVPSVPRVRIGRQGGS